MFRKIDLFGSQIFLRSNGEQTYKSNLGSFTTLIIISFILMRFIQILLEVINRQNPNVIYSERQVDNPEIFSISSETFPMAFGMEDPINKLYYIDEQIYTISAQWQQKRRVFNSTSQQYDTTWIYQNISVQPCTLQNFQNKDNLEYYKNLNYTNMYCLSPESVISIQGDFPSLIFSQLVITVQQCQINCKSQNLINQYLLKSDFGIQLSDSYVDPTIKDNPFKMYSRDMFWHISTLMPQDITMYLRNNYVYSDIGWFQSNIKTERFPSFSYYENSVYPSGFQDYFLSITMRFEKQKEGVYKRWYQDFISILSEIGGFTQSLLAIGFLLCRRVSQLQLNQKIINQIFNYEESSLQNDQQDIIIETEKSTASPQNQIFMQFQSNLQNKIDQKANIKQNVNNETNQLSPQVKSQEYKPILKVQLDSQNIYQQRKSNIEPNLIHLGSCSIHNSPQALKLNQKLKSSKQQNKQNSVVKPSQPGKQQQNFSLSEKHILNQLIQEDIDNNNNNNSNISPKVLGVTNSSISKLFSKKSKDLTKNQQAVEKHFSKLLRKQTNGMKMGIWEYFFSLFCPYGRLKKKKEIINYSIDKLYQNLDIMQILKRLIEVEKLKRLLLDHDQIKLLDYLPKPTIHLDLVMKKDLNSQKKQEINLLYQDNRSEMQKVKDAFEAYKNILNKDNLSEVDQKIIGMLDQNLVEIFEAQNQSINRLNKYMSINLTDLNRDCQQEKKKQDNLSNIVFQNEQQNSDSIHRNQQTTEYQTKLQNQNQVFSNQKNIDTPKVNSLQQIDLSDSVELREIPQEKQIKNLPTNMFNTNIIQNQVIN
ncbi:small GTP-binding domain protein (macronuclear) [Tetrahymena thermophila SB210]|uniref:Small GTP-binding domain protein n=1 Tax=Tetrahymena thermophila (strain SB210) TaxID=312017 RepID=I7MIJ0_TETTS|nr:small GTP-binding domain protein [Tetrahymena thermophila SB210]EAR93741.2 small GTP-binding domain protein [Tetrahymena thermophila SB210]|eukprot:XP_001013986.2 small GTP-binding domain protein [Tetrahymena thermophila SB210]